MTENPQPHPRGIAGAMTEAVFGKQEPIRPPWRDQVTEAAALAVIWLIVCTVAFGLSMGCLAMWNAVTG